MRQHAGGKWKCKNRYRLEVDEAKDLPGLILQTQTSMRELERLIEAVQRHWLLRKYVNKTNPPPTHPLPEAAAPEKKPLKVVRSPRH